jgi:putative transcriptional regulator
MRSQMDYRIEDDLFITHNCFMNSSNLLGSCLVAMPGVDDRYFQSSLIYITYTDQSIVQGLIVNKPTDQYFSKLIDRMKLSISPSFEDQRIMMGGPLHQDQLFLLYQSEGKMVFSSDFKDLQHMVDSDITNDYIAGIGICEWSFSDLLQEIKHNRWLFLHCHHELLLQSHYSDRMNLVLSRLGIGFEQISSESGHA